MCFLVDSPPLASFSIALLKHAASVAVEGVALDVPVRKRPTTMREDYEQMIFNPEKSQISARESYVGAGCLLQRPPIRPDSPGRTTPSVRRIANVIPLFVVVSSEVGCNSARISCESGATLSLAYHGSGRTWATLTGDCLTLERFHCGAALFAAIRASLRPRRQTAIIARV